jgi:hypothetical protein
MTASVSPNVPRRSRRRYGASAARPLADEATARVFAQQAQAAEQWLAAIPRHQAGLVCGHQQMDVLARQVAAVVEAAGPLGAARQQRLAGDIEQVAVAIFGIARRAHQHQAMAGGMPPVGTQPLHRQHQALLAGARLWVFDHDAAQLQRIAHPMPRDVIRRQRCGIEQQPHRCPGGTRQQRQHLAGALAQAPGQHRRASCGVQRRPQRRPERVGEQQTQHPGQRGSNQRHQHPPDNTTPRIATVTTRPA